MNYDEPEAKGVGEMVEDVCVSHAVDGRVCGNEEQKYACKPAEARMHAGYHAASTDCFDKKDKR